MSSKVFDPWQDDAFAYALTRQHPAFFMQMRLGKTLVTQRHIAHCVEKEAVRRALWFTSGSSFHDWKLDAQGEGLPFVDYQALGNSKRRPRLIEAFESGRFEIALMNHELLRAEPLVADMPWDYVVMDESAKIKNPQAEITKLATRGFRSAKHRAILSGKPAPESELEYFCQFQFLHGVFMGCRTYWDFRAKYFEPDPFSFQGKAWRPKAGVRKLISEAISTKAFIKLRSEIRSGEKVRDRRYVPCTPQQAKLQKDIAKEMAYVETDTGYYVETNYAPVVSGWLRRVAGGFSPDGTEFLFPAKLQLLTSLLNTEFSHQKVVVWCYFQEESRVIAEHLRKHGRTVAMINGDDVPMNKRDEVYEPFLTGHTDTLVATIGTAKTGKDLSMADVEIYYSNDWSADSREQSEDRIISMRHNYPKLVLDLIAEDTADEDVVDGLWNKSIDSSMVLSNWLRRWAA